MTARIPAQIPLDLPTTPSLDREDLVVGEANLLAVGAIDTWPDWPHPVVVVVGPPGSGKTHLASAWAERADADRFSAASRRPASASPFAVLVEDIDRGGYDEGGLFSLLNAARLGEGSVLVTSRVLPSAMAIELPDLRSRLRAATVVELRAPDEALLGGVIVKLASDRQIGIDPRLVAYAVARMERSLDAAAAFVHRLDRESLAGKARLTRMLVQRILSEMEVESPSSS